MTSEIQFDPEASPHLQQVIKDLIAAYPAVSGLNEIVRLWTATKLNGIEFATGLDDDDRHNLVAVIFSHARRDLAFHYISTESVRQAFPRLRPISSFIECMDEESLRTIFKKKELNEYESKLGLRYNYDLYSSIVPFGNLVEYAMTYAIDNIGEAKISLADRDTLFEEEDPEDRSLLTGSLLRMSLHFGDGRSTRKDVRSAFGTYCYSVLPAAR